MIGKRLGNRYKLVSRLGSGGMAVVYLAEDLVLGRHVAVKVLNDSLSNDESFVDRFRREARAAASLSHPNVVNIYDVGQDERVHYIVMEYIEGTTLKERIRQEGALPLKDIVSFGEQIADALHHAHENGIVHRDVKSHNIMIGPRGRVKVTDFGIARATSAQTITHTGSVMGSVHYFSPEQARGGVIGEKSDIYSLGVVLYEMATGTLPFSGDSPIAIALKHLQEEPVDPIKKRAAIPQSLDNCIRRAMAKDPLHRYETAHDLMNDLKTAIKPSRLNEPRWEPDDLDGEETRVVPVVDDTAIATDTGDHEKTAIHPLHNEENKSNSEGNTTVSEIDEVVQPQLSRYDQKNSRWMMAGWRKIGLAVFTVLLIGVLSIMGLNLLWTVMANDSVEVPEVEGLPIEEATAKLKDRGLKEDIVEEEHTAEEGTVFRQSPKGAEKVKRGFTVKLYVSKGIERVQIPNMINSPVDEAKKALLEMGFSEQNVAIEQLDDENYAPGHVVKQDPVSGTKIATSEKVTLYVRPEEDLVEVPNLIGEYQSTAEEKLRALGFQVYRNGENGAIYDRNANTPLYRVFGSTPAPGTMYPKGEVVRLHVSLNASYGKGSQQNYRHFDGSEKDEDGSDDNENDRNKGEKKGKKD